MSSININFPIPTQCDCAKNFNLPSGTVTSVAPMSLYIAPCTLIPVGSAWSLQKTAPHIYSITQTAHQIAASSGSSLSYPITQTDIKNGTITISLSPGYYIGQFIWCFSTTLYVSCPIALPQGCSNQGILNDATSPSNNYLLFQVL